MCWPILLCASPDAGRILGGFGRRLYRHPQRRLLPGVRLGQTLRPTRPATGARANLAVSRRFRGIVRRARRPALSPPQDAQAAFSRPTSKDRRPTGRRAVRSLPSSPAQIAPDRPRSRPGGLRSQEVAVGSAGGEPPVGSCLQAGHFPDIGCVGRFLRDLAAIDPLGECQA